MQEQSEEMSSECGIITFNLKNLFKKRSPLRETSFETAFRVLERRKGKKRRSRGKGEGICLTETINFRALEWIVENCSNVVVKEEQKKFLNYASFLNEKNDSKLVNYYPVEHGKGRLYAEGALSLQGFSHSIRESLARGIYHDIDMVNCHPFILIWICKEYDLLMIPKKLKYYVDNRENVLKMIMERASCIRKDAKILMLSLMYGGKWNSWYDRLKSNNEIGPKPTAPPFINEYAKELGMIASELSNKFPEFPSSSKSENAEFSRMSIFIQNIENKILMQMLESLKKKGFKPGILMYDGMMVYRKKRGSTKPMDPKILRKVEKEIKEKMNGIEIKLEEKPIGEGFNINFKKEEEEEEDQLLSDDDDDDDDDRRSFKKQKTGEENSN